MTATLAQETARRAPASTRRARGVLVLSVATFLLYAVMGVTNYLQYKSTGYDLSIFDQAVRAYSHLQAPVSAVKAPGYNILGDHFHPILMLLAPLYWIWDNPSVLLVVQAALIAASVPSVHRFARRRAASGRYALVLAGVYAFGWPLWSMANFDFHEIAFAVPLLAAALDALDRRDTRKALLWSALLLLVKEDMGMILVAVAILAAVLPIRGAQGAASRWRGRQPRLAVALLALGIAGYLLTTELLIPAFAPGHRFSYFQYPALGPNLTAALTAVVTNPVHALYAFLHPAQKAMTLVFLLAPLAGLCLRSGYAIVAIPLLAERFFNSRSQLWSTHNHYNALPWVVLALAAIDGVAAVGLLADTPRAARRRAKFSAWFVIAGLLAVAGSLQIEDMTQSGGGIITRLWHWNDAEVRDLAAADAQVPDNVCVEADDFLVTHLTPRDYATLPDAPGIHPDFILVNTGLWHSGPSQTGTGGDGPTTADIVANALRAGYQIVWRRDTLIELRSPDYSGPSAQCSPLGSGRHGTV
jgi:uncharacterized membrane protein